MIGNILKELRKEKNITAKELSKYLGFSLNIIYEWEHNRCEPSLDIVVKLSKYFNVSLEYLLGLEDDFGVKNYAPDSFSIHDDEKKIIKQLRTLDPFELEYIRGQIQALSDKKKVKQ